MTYLIDIEDIRGLKSISINTDAEEKLMPFILEAQQFDLKKIMGDAFFLDFMKDFEGSPSLVKYSLLFNGGEFTCGNNTYRHEGIKTVLCYLSYARYVLNSNINSTAFGTVKKKTEESEHVDDKTINRLYDQAYSGAMEYWRDVVKFLDQEEYPLWRDCCNKKIIGTTRISGVSADCDTYLLPKRRRYI